MHKKCSKCKETKAVSLFTKDKTEKDGFSGLCKDCKNSYKRNPKKSRDYYQKTKEKKKQRAIERRDEITLNNKLRYQKNKESIKQKRNAYYQQNKEIINAKKRISGLTEAERIKKNTTVKQRRESNPTIALAGKVRMRVYAIFRHKKLSKEKKSIEYIGCDIDILKKHIERQFTKGMTWDNNTKYGWHIDHKIPLSSAQTIEDLIPLLHYTNLQPLWASENLSKNDKILPTQMKIAI